MEVSENQKNKIMEVTTEKDYAKGLTYPEKNIQYVNHRTLREREEFLFRVRSSHQNRYYFVEIDTEEEIVYTNCTCPQYDITASCKHIAACLIQHAPKLLKEKSAEQREATSLQFMQEYLKEGNYGAIKQEVKLEFYFTLKQRYWGYSLSLNMRIGTDKMYALTSKLRNFLMSYEKGESFRFGKSFIYSPYTHYFSSQMKSILKFLSYHLSDIHYDGMYLDRDDLKELLPLLKQEIIYFNEKKIAHWIEACPYPIHLKKEEEKYCFEIDTKKEDVFPLTENYEYALHEGSIYHTDLETCHLISKMKEQKLSSLLFGEKDLTTFSKAILPLVKEEITLDESVNNIVIGKQPDVKIYLDLKGETIEAKLLFEYQKQEMNYFEKQISTILRDEPYEKTVVDFLTSWSFMIEKQKFILSDLDAIGFFLEEGLKEMTEKYEVFTSKKLQEINVKKNNIISTTFSIGKDNAMHYDFQLGAISEAELESVLDSLKKKKKYFKLKSGDLLSLENDNLQEFQELVDELDMDYETLKQTKGTIPKYYALYIDSLKEKKSRLIQTDNLFQQFIDQFQKYKKVELSFTKEEIAVLRDYQVAGVKWLYTLHKCGFGGVLADEMGLGKSLQTIIFLRKILEEKKESKFLIVAPTSLIYNWKNEFLKFAQDIPVTILAGNKKMRMEALQAFDSTVYITTYGLLREDLELYSEKEFEVCVIDEAQNIKNPKAGLSKATKKINATTKIALTGTPIENSVTELWSIFDYLMPGYLSSLVKFQEKYRMNEFNDQTDNLLSKLKEQVRPFLLRRKKTEVAKDLPPKIENNIYIDLSEEEKKLYAAEVKRVEKEMQQTIAEEGFLKARFKILVLMTKLRQLCISPQIIYENYNKTSAKMENLMKVLKEVIENGHKVLLFTNFRTALELVREELKKEQIKSYTIDGSVPSKTRMQLVESFNRDDTPIFLIMLKSGGTGLNLTSADVVIHLDLWWNPQAENQATDRTHRIGQTKTVEVVKLIAKGTIEERILELQEKKKLLSEKLIENNNTNEHMLSSLTEEDILHLLSFENREGD